VKHGHQRHGTRSRHPLAGLAAAAGLAIGILAAIGAARAAPAAAQATDQVTAQEGARLYIENCATCHGPRGEGTLIGPRLIGVGPASVDFYLRTGRMPLGAPNQQARRGEPIFNEGQIAAIVQYVASFGGDGPPIPSVRPGGDVRKGWELYTTNCAACHAATGAGNAVGGGFVAYGLGQATDLEIAEAMLIGPGAMPRFQFTDEERDAIIAYVDYLRTAPAPGGAPIGGFGPVAEGFVAVFVGLTGLVLVAMFVGRRSHAGEPGPPTDGVAGAEAPPAADRAPSG
jgi:ubiquinol-cytochrome c reductase cytochrome c subunit